MWSVPVRNRPFNFHGSACPYDVQLWVTRLKFPILRLARELFRFARLIVQRYRVRYLSGWGESIRHTGCSRADSEVWSSIKSASAGCNRRVCAILFTEQETFPARNMIGEHALDFAILLAVLQAFAQRAPSLHTTRNAWCFQSVCSTGTACRSYRRAMWYQCIDVSGDPAGLGWWWRQ